MFQGYKLHYNKYTFIVRTILLHQDFTVYDTEKENQRILTNNKIYAIL
jgi:hypothetical protein